MQIACYCDLPRCPDFDRVGVSFAAKSKSGTDRCYFWAPHPNNTDYRAFIWETGSQSWRELDKPLPPKRLANLWEFWQAQTDIGLWVAASRRAAAQKPAPSRKLPAPRLKTAVLA